MKKYKEYFTSSIVTNGYLLSEDIISKLVNDCNCRFIQITFDGPEKIHDSICYAKGGKATYNTLMQNLKYCLLEKERNDDLAIIARINLLNLSTEDFSSIFDSFSEIQLKNLEVMLRPVFSTGAYKEKNATSFSILEKYYSIVKEKGANIFKGSYKFQHCESDGYYRDFHLMPDLSISKCVLDNNFEQSSIGFMNENGDVQYDYFKLNEWYRHNPFEDEKCRKCLYLPICYGGCRLYYRKHNSIQCPPKEMLLEALS